MSKKISDKKLQQVAEGPRFLRSWEHGDIARELLEARQQLAAAREVCELLDTLDWVIGYDLSENNSGQLDLAVEKARLFLEKGANNVEEK